MTGKTHKSLLRRLVVWDLVSEGRGLTSFQKVFEKVMLTAGVSVRWCADSETDLRLIQSSQGGEDEEREPLGLSLNHVIWLSSNTELTG